MRRGAVALAIFTLLGSCKRKNDGDGANASAAVDSTDVAQSESSLLVAATDGITASTPEGAAGSAVITAPTIYTPSSCVTATASGATTTYVLDDCTGPFGLVHVTGTVVVVYSIGADGLHADATATGLMVNGATMDVSARGVYSLVGTTRQLVVSTSGAGTGPRGVTLTREGDYTVTWDQAAGCVGLDGAWETTAAGHTWSTTVSGYGRCADMCPEAGGSITHTGGLSGVTITVTFDGDDTAAWESSRGGSGTIDLLCAP